MSVDSARGFTIIEVVLFLAITGGLFAALMIGVNTGITQQRYLDSVRSYKGLVQNQYSEVLNTRNDNSGDSKCNEDDKDGSLESGAPADVNGTSNCVILGRAIQIKDNGTEVVTSSVTGYDKISSSNDSSDITVLKDYKPKLSSFDTETTDIDWSGNLRVPATTPGGTRSYSTAVILILRSPTTGSVRLFTSPTPPGNDLSAMITDTNAATKAENCMDIEGGSGLLPKQLVTIDPRISSPDAVTTDGGRNSICQ